MSTQNRSILKNLLEAIPPGFMADTAWLERHGVSRFLARKYVENGWLERVNRGVFRRPAPSTAIDWKTCLLSMQHIMRYDIHIGGTTALSLQGYDHYLRLGSNAPVWVYGDTIPSWLSKLPLTSPIKIRNTSLFSDSSLGLANQRNNDEDALPWEWVLNMSMPERAVMEAMDELPDHESFHHLDMLFESLTTLRPKVLSVLLHSCKKIKVKRLFFVFADRHDHPWRKRLDVTAFNLGSGDRALVKGGKIHPRYRIMVPAEFTGEGASDGT